MGSKRAGKALEFSSMPVMVSPGRCGGACASCDTQTRLMKGESRMTRIRTLLAALVGMVLLLALATGPASATATNAKISIANQATLLTSGDVVVTVTYTCAPGLANDTTGMVVVDLQQGTLPFSAGDGPATCDNRQHTANIDVLGPFSQGTANALAIIDNSNDSSFATTSRGVTIK
jgi:hypothetical protein